jgi:hypothetical protein
MQLNEVADKYNITQEQAVLLRSAMHRTWGQIYYDLVQLFEGGETELYDSYKDEAAMIAENTLDADRVTSFCPGWDLKFVYRNSDGSWRHDVIEMGEAILRAQQ